MNLDTESAAVYAVPDAKLGENWRQELGEELATHLTTCGFKSNFSYASVNEAWTEVPNRIFSWIYSMQNK